MFPRLDYTEQDAVVRREEVMPPPSLGPDVVASGERGNALAISLKKIDS